jgi:hypothetical protein
MYIDPRHTELDSGGGNVGTITNWTPGPSPPSDPPIPIEGESPLYINGQAVRAELDGLPISWQTIQALALGGAITGSGGRDVGFINGKLWMPLTRDEYNPRWETPNEMWMPSADGWSIVDLSKSGTSTGGTRVYSQPKIDDKTFRDCLKSLFNTTVNDYSVGREFSGNSDDYPNFFDRFLGAIFGFDATAFNVHTNAITSLELKYKVGGPLGAGANVVYGWTYEKDPHNNFIVSDIGSQGFRDSIWVYELGNALGYITWNRPTVSDIDRYGIPPSKQAVDVGGALVDCVFGGQVRTDGRIVKPRN